MSGIQIEIDPQAGFCFGVVMDGRDIGTVVFPHAELKVFVTADAELKVFVTADAAIRAQRRYAELKASGKEVDYEQVLENVRQRDQMDEHRADSPLRKADDALLLDNGHLTRCSWSESRADGRGWLRGFPCSLSFSDTQIYRELRKQMLQLRQRGF